MEHKLPKSSATVIGKTAHVCETKFEILHKMFEPIVARLGLLLLCFHAYFAACLEPSLLISIFLTKNTIPSAHVRKQAIFGLKLGN